MKKRIFSFLKGLMSVVWFLFIQMLAVSFLLAIWNFFPGYLNYIWESVDWCSFVGMTQIVVHCVLLMFLIVMVLLALGIFACELLFLLSVVLDFFEATYKKAYLQRRFSDFIDFFKW